MVTDELEEEEEENYDAAYILFAIYTCLLYF